MVTLLQNLALLEPQK